MQFSLFGRQVLLIVLATSISSSIELMAQPGQLANCDPNQHLFSSSVVTSTPQQSHDVVRTNHNCGTAFVGGGPSGQPYITALRQDGSTIFANSYGSGFRQFYALTESIENNMPYLIALGHSTAVNRLTVKKVDANSGAPIWERSISLVNSLGQNYSDFIPQDIVAHGSEYYILATGIDDMVTQNGNHDMVLFKLDANGATVAAFGNHVYEPLANESWEMDPSGLHYYEDKLWVTGWVDHPDDEGRIFDRTFLLEINPSNGAVIRDDIYIHEEQTHDAQGRAADLWVGQLQGSPTNVVITGNLIVAAPGEQLAGGFVNRIERASGTLEGRQIRGPLSTHAFDVTALKIDYAVGPERGWVIAGHTLWADNGAPPRPGAFLIEFNEIWHALTVILGRWGTNASDETRFSSVSSWGINGSGTPPTLEEGYTAVGLRERQVSGGGVVNNSYIVKVDANLLPADDCDPIGGPRFNFLETVERDLTLRRKLTISNVASASSTIGVAHPTYICYELQEISKRGVTNQDAIPGAAQPLSNSLSITSHVEANSGVRFFFEAEHADAGTVKIVDALGKTLTEQPIQFLAGSSDMFVPVKLDASSIYYALFQTQGKVHSIALPFIR